MMFCFWDTNRADIKGKNWEEFTVKLPQEGNIRLRVDTVEDMQDDV